MQEDNPLLSFIQSQINFLQKSIDDAKQLHIKDTRMHPNDGYENYTTIVEQQILNALTYEQNTQLAFWKSKKEELLNSIEHKGEKQ